MAAPAAALDAAPTAASAAGAAAPLRIEVVYSALSGATDRVALTLPAGSTLAAALQASGLLERHALQGGELHVGIWGKARPLGDVLRDRDRVEIYRPLRVDPKEARRLRHRQQGGTGGRSEPGRQRPETGGQLPRSDAA